MTDDFVAELADPDSDWNAKREDLEDRFLKAGAALLEHTRAAEIEMADYGVYVTLKLDTLGSAVN